MKFFTTLSIAMLAITTAFGQRSASPLSPNYSPVDSVHNSIINMLMTRQVATAMQKSTGIKQRVIAESDNWGDSIHHYYPTNQGGSRYDYNNYRYNNWQYYSPNDPYAYFPGYTYTSLPMHDSLHYWAIPEWDSIVKPYYSQYMSYNANRKLKEYVQTDDLAGGDTLVHLIQTYDAQGRLTAILRVGFGLDTAAGKMYTYDANGHLASVIDTMSTQPWVPAVTTYEYDANGNLTTIIEKQFDPNANDTAIKRTTATYYPSHQLKTALYENGWGSSSTFTFYARDSFGYANSSSEFFSFKKHDGNSPGNYPYLNYKRINAAGLPDSSLFYYPDSTNTQWSLFSFYTFNYDSNNNPIKLSFYGKDASSNIVLGGTVNYYYENYEEDLAVNAALVVNNSFCLYPNPAKQTLNISWEGWKQTTPVTIKIVNATGQLVRKEELKWMQHTETVNITNLQPGMYWISISDAKGKMFSQSFLKQ